MAGLWMPEVHIHLITECLDTYLLSSDMKLQHLLPLLLFELALHSAGNNQQLHDRFCWNTGNPPQPCDQIITQQPQKQPVREAECTVYMTGKVIMIII